MVAVDDTLCRRRGRNVHGAGWFHDGSAVGLVKLGFGNNWVIAAIIVTLPLCARPVALPVLTTLTLKSGRSKPDLARELVDCLAERFADRAISFYQDLEILRELPASIDLYMGMVHPDEPPSWASFHCFAISKRE